MIQPEELQSDQPLLWSPGRGSDLWELFTACVAGDLTAVEQLIARDPSLVRSNFRYRKPLYFAVRENRLEVAGFLLDRDPDPLGLWVNDGPLEIARDRGYTEMERLLETKLAAAHNASPRGEPVAAALRARDLAKVRALLDAEPELLHAGDRGSSQPIHWATMTRQLDAIDLLLERGADIDARRSDGARPIHLSNGDYNYRGWRDVPPDTVTTPDEVLAHVRARGANIDICVAASSGDLERVRELLDQDPSLANRPSEYVTYYAGSGTPLRNAAGRGHLAIVRLLLDRGADPNLPEEHIAPRGHALYSAVSSGHYDIARLLLEQGAYPSPPVESSADALSIALGRGDQKMVELLCSYGSARSLELLAHHGDVVTAAAVFAANPALADDPLALANAASNGHQAFVRLLLRYQPGLPGRIAVDRYWTIGARTRELAELLFRHGMNPSQADWLGITPLHHFARNGNLEMAALYLDRGADLGARDEDLRSTPLGWAAKAGQLEMVRFLLRRGARPRLPDDPSWATPLAWAERRGHSEVAALLRTSG